MKKQPAQLVAEWFAACPRWQIFTALGVFGLIVYAGAIFHPFVHDDIFFIVQNPSIIHFNLWKTFLHPLDMGMAGVGINVYYRPLLDLVNHLQYLVFGFNPHGFHFFNICMHIINSCLVYALVFRVLEGLSGIKPLNIRWAALITSAIFMIHPVQTQAVDCVSGISNLLFVCLGLCASLLYLKARRETRASRSIIMSALSMAVFLLAVLAKEQALVFALLIAWFECCAAQEADDSIRTKIIRVSGWFAVIIFYLIWKKFLLGSHPLLDGNFFSAEWWLRVANIPKIILINLGLVIVPHDLHYFRSLDILGPKVPAFMGLAGLILSGIVLSRRAPVPVQRVVLFGCGWFVLAQILTINIVPLIWEYSYISVAEHFLYLPMIGIVLIGAVAVLECASSRWSRDWIAAGSIIVIALFSVITIRQHAVWASEVALFERVVRFEPGLGRVQMLLGQAYYADGKFHQAIKAYSVARDRMLFYEEAAFGEKTKAFYRVMRKDINRGLAVSHQALGDSASAEKYFLEALALAPEDAATHNDLGVLYTVTGETDRALEYFRKAFDLKPHDALFIKNYALALAATGSQPQAVELVKKALMQRADPGLADFLRHIEKSP